MHELRKNDSKYAVMINERICQLEYLYFQIGECYHNNVY